jgi:hypothetical protein
VDNRYRSQVPHEPGMLTHLTRLTRLRTRADLDMPNDPALLPSAGGSLRVIELVSDGDADHKACVEALLPVAAGLEALEIDESCLKPADAARLAAALPRGIARLRVAAWDERVWSALPITHLELELPPANLTLLAGASRLECLSIETVQGVEPAALAAALQALPRLRALDLGASGYRLFEPDAAPAGGPAAPEAAALDGAGAVDAFVAAVDAFVAAVAGLPSLRKLILGGCNVGRKATAALLEAAPRLSVLRLTVCGLDGKAAKRLSNRLRAAAGRGALSLKVRAYER